MKPWWESYRTFTIAWVVLAVFTGTLALLTRTGHWSSYAPPLMFALVAAIAYVRWRREVRDADNS